VSANLIDRPSPNYDERDKSVSLDYVVLHYTGMPTCDEALKRLCDPAVKVSAHYVINEQGGTYKLVDETKRAWHAGKSFWKGVTDLNSASIGIELVNPGHEHGYVPFPAVQIRALLGLLADIAKRQKLKLSTGLLGHSDIAPARKTDPGELFPWKELAQKGFGLWPEVTDKGHAELGKGEDQKLLQTIGYDISALPSAWMAFQRRYDPDNLTGKPAKETMAKLRTLARMIDTQT
jgi:N-acetylmuramoyl-L-alanine amidase